MDKTSQSEDLASTTDGQVVDEDLRERAKDLTTSGTRVEIFDEARADREDVAAVDDWMANFVI